MTLVNWSGSAIFGPGSEWFWSMAQFILVAGTLLAIYQQIRAQRASSLYDQTAAWERDWNEEQFVVSRLKTLIDIQHRPPQSGLPPTAAFPGNNFDRLGYLVAQGHLSRVDVWHVLRMDIALWWAILSPYIESERITAGADGPFPWFERLEQQMRRLDRKILGIDVAVPGSAEAIDLAIDSLTARLKLQADAKLGIFPSRTAR